MEERENQLDGYNDRIPERFREDGWRVLMIASGHTLAGERGYTAILQNESRKASNGYFPSFGWTKEEAVDAAIQTLLNYQSPE